MWQPCELLYTCYLLTHFTVIINRSHNDYIHLGHVLFSVLHFIISSSFSLPTLSSCSSFPSLPTRFLPCPALLFSPFLLRLHFTSLLFLFTNRRLPFLPVSYLFSSPPFPFSFPFLGVMSMTCCRFSAARRCSGFLVLFRLPDSFSALTLSVGRQEEHPSCQY